MHATRKRPDPRGRRSVALLLLCAIVAIAVHLFYPAPRTANEDLGGALFLVLAGGWTSIRGWRERRSDMPVAVAWLFITAYGFLYAFVGFSHPHRQVLWFLNPYDVMVLALLVVALGTRPRVPRTE